MHVDTHLEYKKRKKEIYMRERRRAEQKDECNTKIREYRDEKKKEERKTREDQLKGEERKRKRK